LATSAATIGRDGHRRPGLADAIRTCPTATLS
jgi:hypothetical protein